MNNRQGELTAHGRNCVTIIAVRASFCLIRMLLCKKEWRMGDEIVGLVVLFAWRQKWIQTRTTYTQAYIETENMILPSLSISTAQYWYACDTCVFDKIGQINHRTLWKTMTSPQPPRCSPIDAPPKNAAFLSIRWGYFLPVKMPYGFGQWNLLHPARETKGVVWGAPGIANGTQVDMNFIDKHVQLLALWESTIWYIYI